MKNATANFSIFLIIFLQEKTSSFFSWGAKKNEKERTVLFFHGVQKKNGKERNVLFEERKRTKRSERKRTGAQP